MLHTGTSGAAGRGLAGPDLQPRPERATQDGRCAGHRHGTDVAPPHHPGVQQRTEASSSAYQESEERLQLALATTSTLGIWDWDIDEDRFVADNNFARMHGLDPLTAGKHLISDYLQGIHPDDRELVARSVRNCLLDNAEYSEEYRLLQTGGPRAG